MKSGLFHLFLVASMPASFVIASSSFLSNTRSRTNSQAVALAGERLQLAADQLAQALGREAALATPSSMPKSMSGADHVVARDHLVQEVGRLLTQADADDRRGLELLRGYVIRTPPTALIWPLSDLSLRGSSLADDFSSFDSDFDMQPRVQLGAPTSDDEVRGTASSTSEETIVRDGKVIKHFTRCVNGDCIEQTRVDKKPSQELTDEADKNAIFVRDGRSVDHADFSVRGAVESMAREMNKMYDLIGAKSLDAIMDNLSKAAASEGFEGKNEGASHAETYESETDLRNGQLMRSIRQCKDGHCTTQFQKANAAAGSARLDGNEQQTAKKAEGAVDMPL